MRNFMLFPLVFSMLNMLFASHAYACLDHQSVMQIKTNEEAHLLSRNVATMTDALYDQLLTIQVKQMDGTCKVSITYTLPELDIAEANQLLNANPAKRIMLAGQGYELPSQTMLTAVASVEPTTLSILHEDILQSAPLGKNRASVELLYASLAQTRAVIKPDNLSTEAWPVALVNVELSACNSQYTSQSNPDACACRVHALSQKISPRQLKYIQYLANDPYSSATGALSTYQGISEQVNFECKLNKR